MASDHWYGSGRARLVLAVVGVLLVVFAVVWTLMEFEAEVKPNDNGLESAVTVECGNAFDARGLSASTEADRAELVFPDEEDADALSSVGAGSVQSTLIDAADACQSDASGRLRVAGAALILGVAAIVVTIVLFRRARAPATPPSSS